MPSKIRGKSLVIPRFSLISSKKELMASLVHCSPIQYVGEPLYTLTRENQEAICELIESMEIDLDRLHGYEVVGRYLVLSLGNQVNFYRFLR